MRRHALTMGAAVLVAVPVVISPLTASAAWSPPVGDPFFDAYQMWRGELEEFENPWDEVGETLAEYTGIVTAITYTVSMGNDAFIIPAEFSTTCGFYTGADGKEHFGSVCRNVQSIISTGYEEPWPIPYIVLEDRVYTISIVPTYSASTEWENEWRFDPYSTGGYEVRRFHNHQQEYLHSDWLISDGSDYVGGSIVYDYSHFWSVVVSDQNIAPTWPGISAALSTGTPILGRGITISSIPQSNLYPTITRDNVSDYIEDILNPAYLTENPDIEPFLFDPNAVPYEAPTYPVQETWAQDADWPDGNLLPTIPAASYTVEIPQIMTEGVSFWWHCLSVLFDGLGITAVVVGLLALGIVLYFVLR